MTRPYQPDSNHSPKQHSQGAMPRLIAGAAVAVLGGAALLASGVARADDTIAAFDGGIGVVVAARTLANPSTLILNDVFGVPPGGRPWVISALTASASTTTIRAKGKGLLLAGGNGVGTNGNQVVHATLICNGLLYESAGVPLEANGDFTIDGGFVGANGNPPSPCGNARLLIVNAGGAWFAAGIPKP